MSDRSDDFRSGCALGIAATLFACLALLLISCGGCLVLTGVGRYSRSDSDAALREYQRMRQR